MKWNGLLGFVIVVCFCFSFVLGFFLEVGFHIKKQETKTMDGSLACMKP